MSVPKAHISTASVELNLFVATENKNEEEQVVTYGYNAAINIPKAAFIGVSLAERVVKGVESEEIGYYCNGKNNKATLPRSIDFIGLLENLKGNQHEKNDLKIALKNFVKKFLPELHAKHPKQLLAELENLEHIKSCVDEMLNKNGLNFKAEFVAKVITHRLNMAMFGFFDRENIAIDNGQYKPVCMWDFGEDRAFANVTKGKYTADGETSSPSKRGRGAHKGNPFSFIRGRMDGRIWYDLYVIPDSNETPSLPNRFRQYLAHITEDNSILNIGQNDAVTELPAAMMFLVGLQFGQNNVGTWNKFTLAAKMYLASQCDAGINDFFWENGGQKNDIANVFQPLCDSIANENGDEEIDTGNFPERFEIALCAYYAMNQEILSRVNLPGNDRKTCTMETIFRLEGLESWENIGVVGKIDDDYYANPNGIDREAQRAILVSSSAEMFVNSLDKPNLFPPPIKVITKYSGVHHSRIFGSHLFNVDLGNASRELPHFFNPRVHSRYEDGCPFFKDRQREFLIMPRGCAAGVVGILPWAPNINECYVWSNGNCFPNDGKKNVNFNDIKKDSLCEEIPKTFAEKLELKSNDLADGKKIANAVNVAASTIGKKIKKDGVGSIMPKKILQINFADLSDREITRLASFFANANGDNEDLKSYRDQLKAIKDVYGFNFLYDFSS